MSKHTFCVLAVGMLLGWELLAGPALARQWKPAATMPTPRAGASAAVVGGKIYVVGGQGAGGEVLDVVERYDPKTDTWETGLPPMRDNRVGGMAVALNDTLYALGGRDEHGEVIDDVETFDPLTGQWGSFRSMEQGREGAAAAVIHGEIYVMGGSDEAGYLLDTNEYFDQVEGEWELLQAWHLDQPRASLAAVAIGDTIYILGGFTPSGPWAPVQLYSVSDGSIVMSELPMARGGLAAVSVWNVIYAIGGRNAYNRVVSTVDVYLPEPGLWLEGAPMQTGREQLAAAAVGGSIFVFGGRDGEGNVLGTVERFDISSLGTPALLMPEDEATDVERDDLELVWDTVPDAESYNVQVSTTPAFTTLVLDSAGVTVPSVLIGGLAKLTPYYWRVRAQNPEATGVWSTVFQFTTANSVAVEGPPELPSAPLVLEQNYPNPFTLRTFIPFELDTSAPGAISLMVYDVYGRQVATLLEAALPSGTYRLPWDGTGDDGRDVAAGVYIVRLKRGPHQVSRMVTLVR